MKKAILFVLVLVAIMGWFLRDKVAYELDWCVERYHVDESAMAGSVDVKSLSEERVFVGEVKEGESGRRFLERIIEEGKIDTFDHLHAELCVLRESDAVGEYHAKIWGENFYCTSDCYDDDYSFYLSVKDGEGYVYGDN